MSVVFIPKPPPCEHGKPSQPCCPGCTREHVNAAFNQHDAQRKQQEQQDREAGQ